MKLLIKLALRLRREKRNVRILESDLLYLQNLIYEMEEKHKEKIQKIKDLALRRESRMYEELLENEEKIKTQAAKLSNYAKDRQDAICADEMSGRRKYPNVEKTVNQGGGL